jgi:hypothetical protein
VVILIYAYKKTFHIMCRKLCYSKRARVGVLLVGIALAVAITRAAAVAGADATPTAPTGLKAMRSLALELLRAEHYDASIAVYEEIVAHTTDDPQDDSGWRISNGAEDAAAPRTLRRRGRKRRRTGRVADLRGVPLRPSSHPEYRNPRCVTGCGRRSASNLNAGAARFSMLALCADRREF